MPNTRDQQPTHVEYVIKDGYQVELVPDEEYSARVVSVTWKSDNTLVIILELW